MTHGELFDALRAVLTGEWQPVSRIVADLGGDVHEVSVRNALRQMGAERGKDRRGYLYRLRGGPEPAWPRPSITSTS